MTSPYISGRAVPVVSSDTCVNLRNVDSSFLFDGALASVKEAQSGSVTNGATIYRFDAASTAADDAGANGATVVRPTSISVGNPGRWLQAAIYAPQGVFSSPGVGTTTGQVAVVAINPTLATSGSPQYSPVLALVGNGWRTDVPRSYVDGWFFQGRPQTGSSPESELALFNVSDGVTLPLLKFYGGLGLVEFDHSLSRATITVASGATGVAPTLFLSGGLSGVGAIGGSVFIEVGYGDNEGDTVVGGDLTFGLGQFIASSTNRTGRTQWLWDQSNTGGSTNQAAAAYVSASDGSFTIAATEAALTLSSITNFTAQVGNNGLISLGASKTFGVQGTGLNVFYGAAPSSWNSAVGATWVADGTTPPTGSAASGNFFYGVTPSGSVVGGYYAQPEHGGRWNIVPAGAPSTPPTSFTFDQLTSQVTISTATTTTVAQYQLPLQSVSEVEAHVSFIRTDTVGGHQDTGALAIRRAAIRVVGGTATLIGGASQVVGTDISQTGCDITVSTGVITLVDFSGFSNTMTVIVTTTTTAVLQVTVHLVVRTNQR